MMPLQSSHPPTLKIEVTYTALILSLVLYMCESSLLTENGTLFKSVQEKGAEENI